MLAQPRPEPGGKQLLEGGGGIVGTVHQPVRECAVEASDVLWASSSE